jgi:hypothetical protein
MKFNLILSIVLVCIIAVNATPTKRETEGIFRNMIKNDMGKDLFSTI